MGKPSCGLVVDLELCAPPQLSRARVVALMQSTRTPLRGDPYVEAAEGPEWCPSEGRHGPVATPRNTIPVPSFEQSRYVTVKIFEGKRDTGVTNRFFATQYEHVDRGYYIQFMNFDSS